VIAPRQISGGEPDGANDPRRPEIPRETHAALAATTPDDPASPAPDRFNRFRYSLYAPVYDVLTRFFRPQRRAALAALRLRSGERMLVIGCGTGADFEFVPPGVELTALDVTPGMIDRAHRRADNLGLHGQFIVGDARTLPFPDGRFDAIILHLILAVAPEPERIAREASRVLKPSGRVSIFDKFLPADRRPGFARRLLNVIVGLLFSDINRQVEPMLTAAGWQVTSDQPAGFRGAYRRILASNPAAT
jgi:ubiquinone/menaquinone biosynthesis C-methylase UbiE